MQLKRNENIYNFLSTNDAHNQICSNEWLEVTANSKPNLDQNENQATNQNEKHDHDQSRYVFILIKF